MVMNLLTAIGGKPRTPTHGGAHCSSSPTPPLAASDRSLSQEELYKRIAPSVAFIETPIIDGGRRVSLLNGEIDQVVDELDYSYTGSGVLIEGGYIVAAYLAVWPYRAVRVVFAAGSEYSDVPVVNYDPLAGWALLGPVDTPAAPLSLGNGRVPRWAVSSS